MKAKLKKAFTLIEMLIVVIIIGVLMSALIPRLKGAQERARDTARKANLAQISTALEMYFNDNGVYPDGSCASELADTLIPAYLNSIPTDPQGARVTYGTTDGWCGSWSYGYSPLQKSSASNWWSVLVANIEAFGKVANYVLTGSYTNSAEFTWGTEQTKVSKRVCEKVIITDGNPVSCNENNKIWKVKNFSRMVYVLFN